LAERPCCPFNLRVTELFPCSLALGFELPQSKFGTYESLSKQFYLLLQRRYGPRYVLPQPPNVKLWIGHTVAPSLWGQELQRTFQKALRRFGTRKALGALLHAAASLARTSSTGQNLARKLLARILVFLKHLPVRSPVPKSKPKPGHIDDEARKPAHSCPMRDASGPGRTWLYRKRNSSERDATALRRTRPSNRGFPPD